MCPHHSASLDFANPDAVRQLTRALLKEDFGVADWWIPDGQLIPPVPNRLNYIHWIEDLLRLSSPPGATVRPPPAPRIGQQHDCNLSTVSRQRDGADHSSCASSASVR